MKTHFCQTQSRIQKQLRLGLSYCLSLASVLAISAEAIAMPVAPDATAPDTTAPAITALEATAQTQPGQTQVAQSTTPETTSTDALRLRPSYNINFTEGAGHDGFASFGSFFPLFQTPGENVTFIEGQVSVDTDGDFGGGLQAGYRSLLNDSTIWGAFAGLDVRDTGDRTFTQANVGTELLGDNWDLTLNANLPLGDARQVLSSEIQAANPEFSGNQLLIDEQQVDQVQAALTTVSLDSGLELFDFGSGSSLWGRGGVYFLGGEASEDTLGFRASLDYRPKNNLRLGVGVQNDGIFDTNVIFSVNASLGSSSQRSSETEENSSPTEAPSQLWARAAEPINRTNTVLVEERTDVEILEADVTAINPETGNAFVFRQVDPDAASTPILEEAALAPVLEAAPVPAREGTFEDPFTTIAQAANIAEANADNIIFVQEGNAGGGFTLPDGVQVRSVGPIQQLTTQFGDVILPGSGSGNLPTVTGQVTVGNNTLVSGLEIDPAKFENGVEAALATEEAAIINGIEARGENIILEDNVIANVDRGINLSDIDSTVTIVRNQISNTAGDGIYFDDIDEVANTTITVANNVLNETGDEGIEFDYIENDATANITIANNQITNAQGDSIFFEDIEDDAVATIAISENVINGGGDDGIEIDKIENNANVTITVNNNQINNVAYEGIEFDDIENDVVATISVSGNVIDGAGDAIEFADIENRANATITVNDNQISNARFEGIEFDDIENNVVANITISNNQIDVEQIGIEFDYIENNANATIEVVGNTITSATESGIFFDDIEDAAVANITIADNNILGAATQGIEFDLIEDTANATINIQGNQIANVGEAGIVLDDIEDAATAVITVTGNTITNAGDNGIELNAIDPELQPLDPNISLVVGGNPTESEPNNDEEEVEVEVEDLDEGSLVVAPPTENTVTEASPNLTATITNNTITNPAGDGVLINHTDNTNLCVDLNNNTVTTPGSDGFELISAGNGEFQVVDLANVTARNVGSFNPADIANNAAFVNGTAGEAPCP